MAHTDQAKDAGQNWHVRSIMLLGDLEFYTASLVTIGYPAEIMVMSHTPICAHRKRE